jgi:carbamoyl-phosphate synthase small subunit
MTLAHDAFTPKSTQSANSFFQNRPLFKPGTLYLANGAKFKGYVPVWLDGTFEGEVVFNTGMTGYPEALTDPSYSGQILTFTYPLLGNYGVSDAKTWESTHIQVAGVILHELFLHPEHHSSHSSLLKWLEHEKIPVIIAIDTRALTKEIREHGVLLGAISSQSKAPKKFHDPNEAHLVKKVSITKAETHGNGKYKIIAVDCGMKQNIINNFLKFPVTVKRVPFDYDYSDEDYDGLFISNGPGDPAMCVETIHVLQKALKKHPQRPIFGICLGSQILGLAIGAKTYKLPFGHRGQNQPVIDTKTHKAYLSSQNHGYAVNEKTLPKDWHVSFRHLNDNTVAGITHKSGLYEAVQYHPEACPGPEDANYLFKKFIDLIGKAKK